MIKKSFLTWVITDPDSTMVLVFSATTEISREHALAQLLITQDILSVGMEEIPHVVTSKDFHTWFSSILNNVSIDQLLIQTVTLDGDKPSIENTDIFTEDFRYDEVIGYIKEAKRQSIKEDLFDNLQKRTDIDIPRSVVLNYLEKREELTYVSLEGFIKYAESIGECDYLEE